MIITMRKLVMMGMVMMVNVTVLMMMVMMEGKMMMLMILISSKYENLLTPVNSIEKSKVFSPQSRKYANELKINDNSFTQHLSKHG